jgi:hypothetical protein
MDTLHTVMRSIRGETKSRRNHLSVFREFLHHLDRVGKRAGPRARNGHQAASNNKATCVKNGRHK